MMRITRRFFLQSSGALAAYCGLAPLASGFARTGAPSRAAAGRTLVVVFLRGGADGLSLVVPHASDAYYKLRGWLAVPRPGRDNGALDLDGTFGLNPSAAPLAPFFADGSAVALHAVGHAENTRSHFEEQDTWETGIVGNTVNSDGWLNRHLQTSEGRGPVRAVSIGDALPRILRGKAPALALRGLSELSLGGRQPDPAMVAALEHGNAPVPGHADAARELLAASGRETLEASETLRRALAGGLSPRTPFPEHDIGRHLREAALLVRAGIGVEVVEVDVPGWDTHRNQGAAGGPYAQLVGRLASGLAAFLHELDDRLDDVLVLVASEFGRTAAMNGTGGTDHGWGNCLLAFGGPVRAAGAGTARKVLGQWPGLERDELHEGRELAHTTDFRDVFGEALRAHLGNEHVEAVLPDHEFRPVGLI
jgi:uncharacterized protein (DUF1501 family)